MPAISRPELGALLKLSIDFIPESNQNRSGRRIAPKFITIHNTSNPNRGADAAAHARFVKNKGFYLLNSDRKNWVSWHFTVDDKQVIKHLPVNERAIHAGNGNGVSIGIEVCMNEGIDQAAANLRAQRLAAVLMHDLIIPAENVVPHKHWTGKNCPILLLGDFAGFRSSAEEIRASIETAGEEGVQGTVDGLLSLSEIDSTLSPGEEAEAEAKAEAEENPLEEHDLIAAELEAFIER